MFELLFKYPSAVFSRGTFVFVNGWPVWLLWVAILAVAAALAWYAARERRFGAVPQAPETNAKAA